jgi:hypothetical protein
MANITLIGPGGLHLDQTSELELVVPLGIVQEQTPPVVSATITGSILTATEQEIRDGGLEIILTLTNATWLGAGEFSFDAIRQDILDNIVGAASPTNGWNNEVAPNIPVTAVVRTDDETVTITLPAFPLYNIDGDEGVLVTIPGVANSTEIDILPDPLFFTVSGEVEPVPAGQAHGAIMLGLTLNSLMWR